MELKLNIYNKNEIEKTYMSDTYDIKYGTIEDILDVVDLDKINNANELGKMVIRILPLVKPLLKDIFEELTDEELRRTKVRELIPLFSEIFKYSFDELFNLGGEKN
jgi:hypothetical protein